MKKTLKALLILSMLAVFALGMTACGGDDEGSSESFDMATVEGLWGIGYIDGMEYEEWCAENGVADPDAANSYWTISEDQVDMEGGGQTMSFGVEVKSDGFELLDENGEIVMSATYDAENDIISYETAAADGSSTIVNELVRYEE